MTPYTKQKIHEVTEFIKTLSQRQRDIRSEITRVNNEAKNILNIERTTNSAVIRIATWIKMTLEGRSLEDKLLYDREFHYWMYKVRGFYISKFLAELWGWGEEKYISPCRWDIWRWKHVYFNQKQLYYYIYDMLFPDKAPGVFGFGCEEDIEAETWRTYFKELIDIESKKVKEMRGHLYF